MRGVNIGRGGLALLIALAVPGPALAAEQLTASPSLAGRPGGPGVLTIRAAVTSSVAGVPSPLTRLRIDIPPGVTYHFASAPTCAPATIAAATGATAPACPAGSRIGSGTATVEAALGASVLTEPAALDIYLTARQPVRYEVWGSGTRPIAETLSFPGTFTPIAAPFAEQITVAVPRIPTVPGGPDASVVALDFTVGGTHTVTRATAVRRAGRTRRRSLTTAVGLFDLPNPCPGSLPYTADATFADASNPSITGTVACP